MDETTEKALKEEILAYRKLQDIAITDEFEQFKNRLVKTVATKMIYAFTSESIKTFDDFCRIRGEVIARLQPLQEIAQAGEMAESLEKNLKDLYAPKS
jgi:hypothetical protein